MYGLCKQKQAPKRLKVGRDCTDEEIEEMFGPIVGKNSYRYNHTSDEELCKQVERMWMILHQKTMVSSSRFINCSKA